MKHSNLSKNIFLVLCMFLAAMLVTYPLAAQVDTGGITGTVTDMTGAVVPGARMTLTNPSTGVSQATQSTATGTYFFSGVRAGTYNLKGEAKGFQVFATNGLEVHIQSTLTVDVRLTTGTVSQQVEVTAAAPLLQAENGAVGQTITTQAVNDLPLQSRDWASLAQLGAGVTTAPPGQPSGDSGSTSSAFFVVDGANLWQNDYRLNGINDNIEMYGGASVNSNATITPPPDAIQEFKLQNGNMTAEFGHSTGGVVNATTKSGTNHFHGDVWEYVRNDIFNANLFFNKSHTPLPIARPEYRQNIFGATIGGPVIKDKTFFFFAYQGQRYVTPSPATSTVPTASMVSSGFTNLQDLITYNSKTATDALGRVFPHGTVLDPATTRVIPASGTDPVTGLSGKPGSYVRDPFYTGSLAGKTDYTGNTAQLNVIPVGRIDPNAVKLLGVYPAANGTGFANNFQWTPKTVTNVDTYDVRIDHNFNQSNFLYGTYDRSLYSSAVPSTLPLPAVGQGGGRNDSFPAYAFAVGYTRVFTPTLTNDMHVGMMHADKLQRSVYGNTFGMPAQYGITGIPQVANNGGLPPITINGLTHIGVGNYTPTLQYVYSIEGADTVTKVFRNHTFKTGVQVVDIEGNISQPPQGRGNMTFNGQYTDIPNANSSLTGLADLLLVPAKSTVGGVDYVGGLSNFSGGNIAATNDHRWYMGAFFQDDWKLTPELTLNLGLRWDYFTPYLETSGRQANFVAANGNSGPGIYYMPNKGCAVARTPLFDALLATNNISLKCTSDMALGTAQKTNFAPRLGFAYRFTPRTVVRGGYGIAYGALGNLGYGGTLGTNYPFVYVSSFNSPDSQHPLVPLTGGQPATLENAFTQINIGDPTSNPAVGLNLYGRQYNFQTPYIQSVNLSVQDQFTNRDSIEISYVGSMGRHLDNLGYYNSPSQILPNSANAQNYVPFPGFARNSTYETTNATSSYNSMQATYERQLSSGLSIIANYTFSKCMSDQHTQASQNQQYRAEWLPGFGISKDYALCDTDAPNVVHLAGTYDLPFGHGRMWMASANKPTDLILGGWTVNFIYTYQSGQPFTVNCPNATSAFGCFANVVSGQGLYAGAKTYQHWLNAAAFAMPPVATAVGQSDYSPLGGNGQQARGPHFTNLDASILKNFRFTESLRLQFRAEAFNATNTTPLAQPGSLNFLNPSSFASITGARNGGNASRRLQLALKLFY